MAFLVELWLPIVLSAAFVFIVSSIFHVALPIHAGDFKKLPDEDGARAALGTPTVPPGDYVVPYATCMKDVCIDEMKKKYEEGPVAFLTVLPKGPPAMGKALVQWFLFCVLVSIFVAYVVSFALSESAHYTQVFRLAGTVALPGYAFAYVQDSIWKGRPWGTSIKFMIEGVVYALVTAGTFGWLAG